MFCCFNKDVFKIKHSFTLRFSNMLCINWFFFLFKLWQNIKRRIEKKLNMLYKYFLLMIQLLQFVCMFASFFPPFSILLKRVQIDRLFILLHANNIFQLHHLFLSRLHVFSFWFFVLLNNFLIKYVTNKKTLERIYL